MLGRLVRLPSRVLNKLRGIFGGAPPKAAPAPSAAPRPAPRPRPVVEEADEEDSHAGGGGHDHGHSHSHSHDHAEPAAPPPAPTARGAVSVTPEQTPNPNAMKFTVDRKVAEKGSFSLNSANEAAASPLGKAIFALPGVVSIFGVNNFITVTKDDGTPWDRLLGPIAEALQAHL